MDFEAIGRWFRDAAPRLALEPAETAAERIGERLELLAAGLGVEIAETDGHREVIVTAGRDPALFALAEAVADALAAPGWNVHALKPPRGFAFALEAEGVEIRGEDLTFEPLQSRDAPGVLGIRIFAPDALLAPIRALAWIVVETGIGERAAAHIRHLEVEPAPLDSRRELPIAELGRFVEWHRSAFAASAHGGEAAAIA